jgi:copper(I)-binding protein
MKRAAVLAPVLMAAAAQGADIAADDPWVAVAPPGVVAHAAYMTLTNHGETPRRLVAVVAQGYARAEIHESREIDGMAGMARLAALDLPAGGSAALRPGGLHVMLFAPDELRAPGDIVMISLIFDDGATMTVEATVRKREGGHGHGGHGHGHGRAGG